MEETSKTLIYTPDQGNSGLISLLAPLMQQRGIDPNILLATRNNGAFGNDGGWFVWVLFLLLFDRNGNGWGSNNGNGCNCGTGAFIASQMGNDYGRDLLMQAIQGNANAISQLASNLNCSAGQIQQAVNSVSTQIQSVGAQVGMTSQQIINAIQAGNCSIANQLSQCCCNVTNAITAQGYESRLATLEQTNHLGSKMDYNTQALRDQIAAQTNTINDKFCALEMREQQHTIDTQREQISTLRGQIYNMQQTSVFSQMIGQATAPIAAAINGLQADVNGIKCKLPETVTVPNSPGVLVPNCVAYNMGLYGVTPFNNPGGLWG